MFEIEVFRNSENRPWTYSMLQDFQASVAEEVRAGRSPGKIILSEVAPVVTLGRRTQLPLVNTTLYPTLKINRGGFETFHGPGQWLLFPVLPIEVLGGGAKGIRKAVTGILESTCDWLGTHGITASFNDTEPGVWMGGKKIASLGIRLDRGVVQHGIAMNFINKGLNFGGIAACGQPNIQVGYILEGVFTDSAAMDSKFQEMGLKWANYLANNISYDNGVPLSEKFSVTHVRA